MGTNYYVTSDPPCECCGRGGELKHIGKSSAGWCFSLHVEPDNGINTLDDWQEFWEGKQITNEYGEKIPPEKMLSIITKRGREPKWDKPPMMYGSWEEFHYMNHSEQGPAGLLRHRVDGRHCVGHGEGTYDFITGEFS